MDAKVVISGHGRPSDTFETLKLMAKLAACSPYMSMPSTSIPKSKPQRPFTILRCKECNSTGTLQKVDGEYYCRKHVRVQKGDFNGR